MTLFLETFTGSSLDEDWNVSSNRPAGITVSGGTLNFTGHWDPELATDTHQIGRTFTGDLGGGFLKFWVDMPVVPPLDAEPYLYVQLHRESPLRYVLWEIFRDNTGTHPVGSTGYTMNLYNRFNPASPDSEYHAYDPTKPYLAVLIGDGTATFQNSADGITYSTITTLTSGAVPWQDGFFDVLFNGYENSGWWQPPTGDWTMKLDHVAISYTAPEGPTSLATAQWNTEVYDLAGDFERSAGRFSPVAR